MEAFTLRDFQIESNRIERIVRNEQTLQEELCALNDFLRQSYLQIADFSRLLNVLQPDARLRSWWGRDVTVGDRLCPRGGPELVRKFDRLLELCNSYRGSHPAHRLHVAYEMLHPYEDGNGRSGRALWLWMMGGIDKAPLGFLHHFYYQTLEGIQPLEDIQKET